MDNLRGQVVNGYEFGEQVGIGGLSVVYQGARRGGGLARDVAIQVIPLESPDFDMALETNARLTSRLEHPHLVPLFDYWTDEQYVYLVTRWLGGQSLRDVLDDGPLKLPLVARILEQVASALAAAHRKGLVHRSVKPENILIDADGNAYLADFAIRYSPNGVSPEADETLITAAYLAPEQIEGKVVPQTDIYSLGIVLYEMLTGKHPFSQVVSSHDMERLLEHHLTFLLPPLQQSQPDLPKAVNTLIQKATTKNPTLRPPADTLAAAFRTALVQRTVVQPINLSSLEAGTKIGQYEVVELAGRGGQGAIYKCRHPLVNHPVAIKLLTFDASDDTHSRHDSRVRFEREARTMARLRHSNIVPVYDFGEFLDTPYIVLDYIEGENLRDYFRRRQALSLDEVRLIVRDVASALDYIHRLDLVHRDVKPSNIMLQKLDDTSGRDDTAAGAPANRHRKRPDSEKAKTPPRPYRAILMDFGIAKGMGSPTTLTGTETVGTFEYMSPEQIVTGKNVDGRSDIYALGVMAYQLLTGDLPIKGVSPGQMLFAHVQQPPPDPRDLLPNLPDFVAQAMVAALAKDPDVRPPTAGLFAAALG